MLRKLAPTIVTLVVLSSSALAQAPPAYRYYGVGFGVYPFGYFGFYPSAYSSSWSNGFTLYGPPVPTYGPVPGAFGGSDQRISNFRYGYAALTADKFKGPSYGDGPVRPTYVAFELTVAAADAEVTVNNIPLRNNGTQRTFRATGLIPGIDNLFKFNVKWTHNGREYRQEREVIARAGTTIRLDMGDREPLPAPRRLPPAAKPLEVPSSK